MGFMNDLDISASGLTAQRLRMDTIANNLANAESTRTQNGKGPYRRQVVIFEARDGSSDNAFADILQKQTQMAGAGVRVKEIHELDDQEAPFKKVYQPGHPDADADGYVTYPNVNPIEEMVDMISASRAYEANAKVVEVTRTMALRAINIGK